MTLMLPEGGEAVSQPLGRGLSGMFRRKSKGGTHGVFEVDGGDSLDAFSAGTIAAAGHPAPGHLTLPAAARPPSNSGRGWGILNRKQSSLAAEAAAAAAAAAVQQQQAEELAALQALCSSQGQELASLRAALQAAQAGERAAQERLNMQRFKFELLVDLWAMRVLDNEELGAQQTQQQQQQQQQQQVMVPAGGQ